MTTYDLIFQQHIHQWSIDYMSPELRACLAIDNTPRTWERFDEELPKSPSVWKGGALKILFKTTCGGEKQMEVKSFGDVYAFTRYTPEILEYRFDQKTCMFYAFDNPRVYFHWTRDEWRDGIIYVSYSDFLHDIVNLNIAKVNEKLEKLSQTTKICKVVNV